MALKDESTHTMTNTILESTNQAKSAGMTKMRTVTFREPSSGNKYSSLRVKEQTERVRRPASVPLWDRSQGGIYGFDELTNEMRNLSLRPKSASPALLRRCDSPLHARRAETPIILIPPSGQYGMGKICLRMPGIIRPGSTKTLSLSYSTSALNHNSRLLTEDIDMNAKRRDQAQSTLVRRIEKRLNTLKQNKEAFMKALDEEERRRKEEEHNVDAIKRTDNLLKRRKLEAFMTIGERKQARKERIRVRTSLINYRTANYLKRFDDKHITRLKGKVRYSRDVGIGDKEVPATIK